MRGAAGVPAHDCSFKIPTVWPAERLRVGCRKRIPELATLGILVTLWCHQPQRVAKQFFRSLSPDLIWIGQKRLKPCTNKKAARPLAQKQDPIKPSVYAGL